VCRRQTEQQEEASTLQYRLGATPLGGDEDRQKQEQIA
jgi:hypothetical protein